jgi:hypothetical protein
MRLSASSIDLADDGVDARLETIAVAATRPTGIPRAAEELTPEQRRLVFRDLARGPPNAVLGVELGRQRPARHTSVLPVLNQPRRIFAVTVESERGPHVTEDVVNGAEPVVGPAGAALQERVTSIAFAGGDRYLEHMLGADRVDELSISAVGQEAAREGNSDRPASAAVRDAGEDRVGLRLELCIRSRDEWRVGCAPRVFEILRDLTREGWLDSEIAHHLDSNSMGDHPINPAHQPGPSLNSAAGGSGVLLTS